MEGNAEEMKLRTFTHLRSCTKPIGKFYLDGKVKGTKH